MSINVSLFINNLEKRGFKVKHVKTGAEACEYLLETIPQTDSVGIGGSMTVEQTGIYDKLIKRGTKVHWHWKVPREKMNETREKANNADAYFCSTNAVSMDGTFYNIDGMGNRVAAISYGKQPLYIVMSASKIAESKCAAMDRVKNIACPLNAKRLKLNLPCAITGRCTDCNSPERFCNVTCILERPTGNRDVYVIAIDEKLGF